MSSVTSVAFSVEPSTTPRGCLVPSMAMPTATTQQWPAKCTPSTMSATKSSPDRSAPSSSARAVSADDTEQLVSGPATSVLPSAEQTRGRRTGTRRPPRVASPSSLPDEVPHLAGCAIPHRSWTALSDARRCAHTFSCCSDHKGAAQTLFEPEVGIEPTTCSLRVSCSTTELPGRMATARLPNGQAAQSPQTASSASRSTAVWRRRGGSRRSNACRSRSSLGLRTRASAVFWRASTAATQALVSAARVTRASR